VAQAAQNLRVARVQRLPAERQSLLQQRLRLPQATELALNLAQRIENVNDRAGDPRLCAIREFVLRRRAAANG